MTVNHPPQASRAQPKQANTCAVIVTFHPDVGFIQRLNRITSQFPKVFIVDNGSAFISVEILKEESRKPNVTLIANSTNRGIAAALNQGIQQAIIENYDWAVTFDQDTDIYSGFLAGLLDVYEKSGGGQIVIGSNYDDSHRSKLFAKRQPTNGNEIARERKTLITSGTLVPLEIFDRIGLFREDYFIDSVDHEFSLRARANGYRLLTSYQPFMRHCIGNPVERHSRIRLLLSYHHPPKRKYYISRNTIYTAIRYFAHEPVWSIRQGWRMLSDLVSIILLEDDKSAKLRAFLTGIGHGIRGRMGPIEKTWPNGKY